MKPRFNPDRVAGLELGADDYLPKTFSSRELLPRLLAVIRPSVATPRSSDPPVPAPAVAAPTGIDPPALPATAGLVHLARPTGQSVLL